jgi:hypothetical protein
MNERREQLKAGLVALVVLIGVILILPATGAFADWYNLQNANKTTVDSLFTETTATIYDMDGASGTTAGVRISNWTAPVCYYYWYNTSSTSPLNKNNISSFAAGIFNVCNYSTSKNPRLFGGGGSGTRPDAPNNNGWPYWVIYFNYRAWDAYYDNIVRIKLNLTGLHTGTAGNFGDWGKTITLAWSDGTTDEVFWTTTTIQSDNKLKQYIDLDTNELRDAIIQFGQLSGYLKLTITHQDCGSTANDGQIARGPVVTGSGVYTYSATNLVDRDAGLGAGAMIVAVLGIVGALLVQPNIRLGDLMGRGNLGKGRGR